MADKQSIFIKQECIVTSIMKGNDREVITLQGIDGADKAAQVSPQGTQQFQVGCVLTQKNKLDKLQEQQHVIVTVEFPNSSPGLSEEDIDEAINAAGGGD